MLAKQEINEVYLKLDEIFNLKIKHQIKGTGVLFEKILKVKDVISEEEAYNLIANKKVITFCNSIELYQGLIKIVECLENEIRNEIKFYEEHKNKDLHPDMITLDLQLDELYHKEYKLSKLKGKLLAMLKI